MTRHPIMDHLLWPIFRPYIFRSGDILDQQNRLTVRASTPSDIKKAMLAVRLTCHCGLPYSPFRASYNNKTIRLCVTGPRDDGHKHCSYKGIAKDQMFWLTQDVTNPVSRTETETAPTTVDTQKGIH